MLKSTIVATVDYCTRRPWLVIVVAAAIAVVSAIYSAHRFAISSDIMALISPDSPWRQRELALYAAFPQRDQFILAVVEAPTSEQASEASAALVRALSAQPKLFRSVYEAAGSPFFARNALLFQSTEEVARTSRQLVELEPLLQGLASDQSLRGLAQTLSLALIGAQMGQFPFDNLAWPLTQFAKTIEDVLAGRPAAFSWRELFSGRSAEASDLRRFIEIEPVLDFSALQPGKAATDAIRQAVADLRLASQFGARVRLTGTVPISDDEFGTVREGAFLDTAATVVIVLFLLWLALRSWRIILAVFTTLAVGLAMTTALGFVMVNALNLISVAFAVLFVGIGVDFSIQYSVRYRAERYAGDDLRTALSNAAAHVGVPLTLAAAATAAGFLSFLPTEYRGVSELGQIAGVGMIIAFVMSITLLPALLTVLAPPGEKEPLGYAALAPVDRFLDRHRIPIVAGTGLVVLAGLPLLTHLQFDFNPMNLRSPKVESVATFLELKRDPKTGANAVDVLAPSLAAAQEVAARLEKVPQVSEVRTLTSFVPTDQEQKLALIREARAALEPALNAPSRPAPSDAENRSALAQAVSALNEAARSENGPGAEAARRLAAALTRLHDAQESVRAKAEAVLVQPLKTALDGLRAALGAEPVSERTLPPDLVRQWMTPDGRVRVEALPKGDPNDNETMREFARAVLAVAPNATGGPISILESGRTIITAFIEAGIWALTSITLLLWVTLRRISDVLLTLVPLLLAGVVTLELCVLIGLQLNFANIIALPLLLGIGVAFKIYYVMAWRAGQTNLLQSTLTRAVIFSALTTAVAFGSLWLSNHPGTSSMGKLLALSLVCTLAAAVLFQPALMGRPRQIRDA